MAFWLANAAVLLQEHCTGLLTAQLAFLQIGTILLRRHVRSRLWHYPWSTTSNTLDIIDETVSVACFILCALSIFIEIAIAIQSVANVATLILSNRLLPIGLRNLTVSNLLSILLCILIWVLLYLIDRWLLRLLDIFEDDSITNFLGETITKLLIFSIHFIFIVLRQRKFLITLYNLTGACNELNLIAALIYCTLFILNIRWLLEVFFQKKHGFIGLFLIALNSVFTFIGLVS